MINRIEIKLYVSVCSWFNLADDFHKWICWEFQWSSREACEDLYLFLVVVGICEESSGFGCSNGGFPMCWKIFSMEVTSWRRNRRVSLWTSIIYLIHLCIRYFRWTPLNNQQKLQQRERERERERETILTRC